MKKAVLYLRVSTLDQNPENQFHDLHQLAAQRGFEIVREYVDLPRPRQQNPETGTQPRPRRGVAAGSANH